MRKTEILQKLKAEREFSKEILGTLHMSMSGGSDLRKFLARSSTQSSAVGHSQDRSQSGVSYSLDDDYPLILISNGV
jgi:hypothetical protein